MATMQADIHGIDTKKYETTQLTLKETVSVIQVTDADSCLRAKTLQRDIRSEIKLREAVLSPFVEAAKQNLTAARDNLQKWVCPLQVMDESLATKVKAYEAEERRKAEIEAKRINDERLRQENEKAEAERKDRERQAKETREQRVKDIRAMLKRKEISKREAEKLLRQAGAIEEADKARAAADEESAKEAAKNAPAVTVKPNIPAVAGVPSRVNYRAEIANVEGFLNYWKECKDLERVAYLRQFITINQSDLGAEARKVKDSKKLATMIPFVRAWEE